MVLNTLHIFNIYFFYKNLNMMRNHVAAYIFFAKLSISHYSKYTIVIQHCKKERNSIFHKFIYQKKVQNTNKF